MYSTEINIVVLEHLTLTILSTLMESGSVCSEC